MLLAITLLCVLFAWWHYIDTIHHQRTTCEQALDNELLRIHWQSSQGKPFQALATQWANNLSPNSNVRISFLLPDGTATDNKPPDAYEKNLIANWSKGASTSDK